MCDKKNNERRPRHLHGMLILSLTPPYTLRASLSETSNLCPPHFFLPHPERLNVLTHEDNDASVKQRSQKTQYHFVVGTILVYGEDFTEPYL